MSADRLVVLTGSGISQESGLATFREAGGLWEGHNINEVATYDAWLKNPQKVLDFYNMRRSQASTASPNEAHHALVRLEEKYDVTVITQNVDDLHERAGSTNVVHLHGRLSQARSVSNDDLVVDVGAKAVNLGDLAPDGHQLRPHIVWFGEMVPMIEKAIDIVRMADILIVIGTSLLIYPAAGLVNYASPATEKYILDPETPHNDEDGWIHIKDKAVNGSKELIKHLLNE